MKLNVVSAHLTAILSGAVGLIALIHPGFTEPVIVQALGSTLPVVLAAIVEIYHLLTHRQLQAALAVAKATVGTVTQAEQTVTGTASGTVTPAPTPAPTPAAPTAPSAQ